MQYCSIVQLEISNLFSDVVTGQLAPAKHVCISAALSLHLPGENHLRGPSLFLWHLSKENWKVFIFLLCLSGKWSVGNGFCEWCLYFEITYISYLARHSEEMVWLLALIC